MPDRNPPGFAGWSRWRPTGRWRERSGWFGLVVTEREEWRHPRGDETSAPEFRWRRGSKAPGIMPRAVERAVAERERQWPTSAATMRSI